MQGVFSLFFRRLHDFACNFRTPPGTPCFFEKKTQTVFTNRLNLCIIELPYKPYPRITLPGFFDPFRKLFTIY